MNDKGFTLIELIVTILLLGIVAAMVVPYFLSGITRGADPISKMGTPLGLQTIMANIVADYENNGASSYLRNPSSLSSNIVNGHYGLNANYTITKNSTYKFDANDTDTALKVTIKDNASGQSVTYVFTKQQ